MPAYVHACVCARACLCECVLHGVVVVLLYQDLLQRYLAALASGI